MENERNENSPPAHEETARPTGVLSFVPGIKSMLSSSVRMNVTSPSVNQATQNRLLEVSSSNRSILKDINSIISFTPGASPKSTMDMTGAGVSSTEKESEAVVKSLLNDIVSSAPDKSEAKNRVSGISEISENSFETAIGGEPVGHLPDLVQLGTSFQSGFGSDTDTSAVYESAGENEDSVSPEESYRDFSYDTLYDTPDVDKTKVLDSSAESASSVTATCFTCVDTDCPSDLKENQFQPKKNPALSHLHPKPDFNLSDLAHNLEKLYLQTPLKRRTLTSLPPKSEDNSVLELSASTETEWLDSDVEVKTHGRRLSDPVIVYEGKSTFSHVSGRPSVEVLNVTIENSQKVPDCVELTEDSISECEPVFVGSEPSVQGEPKAAVQQEAPAASTTGTQVDEVATSGVCELKQTEDSNAEVSAVSSALGRVSLKGFEHNDVQTRASCDLNFEENVLPPSSSDQTVGEQGNATESSGAVQDDPPVDTVEATSCTSGVILAPETTVENGEVTPAEIVETASSFNEVTLPGNIDENGEDTPAKIVETSSSFNEVTVQENIVEIGEDTPAKIVETSSSFNEVTVQENIVEIGEDTPAETVETSSSFNEVTVPENIVEIGEDTLAKIVETSSSFNEVTVQENIVEIGEDTPAETVETASSFSEVTIVPGNIVENDKVTPFEVVEASSASEVAVATENTVAISGGNPAIPVVESQITTPAEPIVAADESPFLSSPAPTPFSEDSICSLVEVANPPVADKAAEAIQSPSKAEGKVSPTCIGKARKEPVFSEAFFSGIVKEVESSEKVLKEDVLPAERAKEKAQELCQAERTEESRGGESGEKVTKEVSQAVEAEGTAQEEVLLEEPIKETHTAVLPVEILKEGALQAVLAEETSQEKVSPEEPANETPQAVLPIEIPKEGTVQEVTEEVCRAVEAEGTAQEEVLLEEPIKGAHSAVLPVEILKEGSPEAVVAEGTAQEEVSPEEPAKETHSAVLPVEILKEDTSQAVSAEGIVEVTEEASRAVPVEVLPGESSEAIAEETLTLTPESPKKSVLETAVAEENVTDQALQTEDLSVEEEASLETGEKAVEEVFQAVVAEEKAQERTHSGLLPLEIPEGVSVQAAPAKANFTEEVLPVEPIKDIGQTLAAATPGAVTPKKDAVIAEGNVEVPPQRKEVVGVESTEKVAEDFPHSAPPAEKAEEVPAAVSSEVFPAEPINEEPRTREQTAEVKASSVDTTQSASSPQVNVAVKVESSQEGAGKFVCQTPRIAAIQSASTGSFEFNCSPDLAKSGATSTPLEAGEKLNSTINLDDTIDVATLNTSPDDLNRVISNGKCVAGALDLSKGSEAPLDLSSSDTGSEAPNVQRTPEGPLDLTCAGSATLNGTRTIEVSPLFLKAASGPSFNQTLDVGAFGEPNFNSTFVKHDQTFTQQSNSTFVVPAEQPANVAHRPSPPKARSAFSPADTASKVDSLRSLIAVCEQQEKNLREEVDLVYGEKEPSPDFDALSAEAAKVTEEISLSLREIDQKDLVNETVIMANNLDPFATKSKIAVSPPLGRREAPLTLNGSQACVTLSSKVNTLDFNVSEAGPDTAGDHFQSEEIFRDPATFDFLSQVGSSSSRRELAKESLYVKFDPLVGFTSNTTSDIPLPRSVTMQHNHFETNPAKEGQPERPDGQSGEPASTAVPESTKKVESSVEENPETEPSPPPRTPLRTKATALATETLISLSPAAGPATPAPKKVEASVPATPVQGTTAKDTSLRGQVVTQEELIRRLQEHQIVLEEQDKAYQDRIAELQHENEQLNKKVQDKTQGLNQLSLIMKEYEKTISRLVAEMEQEKKAHEEEKENLVKERDSIQGHLNNIEIAFADLHKKYERSKVMIEGFKKNEEVLNAAATENKANLDKMQNMYDMLKSHAVQKLDTANQELIAIKQRHQQETAKLNAIVKKLEIKSKSLEESLEQKTKENQALAQICDELINANN